MRTKRSMLIKHKPLFTPAGLNLGRMQWCFVKASSVLESKRVITRVAPGNSPFVTLSKIRATSPDGTEYDDHIGTDEIRWWILKRESDVEELYQRVAAILPVAEKLKDDSATLLKTTPKSYETIIELLAKFVDAHSPEILELKKFVMWLHRRDVVAPIILYSSRVWGTTTRSERRTEIKSDKLSDESLPIIKRLTEMALGLVQYERYTLDDKRLDIESQMYEDRDPESDGPPQTPWPIVYMHTAHQVFGECAVYFEHIRNSLRNILSEIESYRASRDLLKSESFWKRFIAKAMPDNKTETQLWDFKETFEMWHAAREAKEKGEIKFCEQLAAWANAKGGVFIVGVADSPRKVKGVGDLENRLQYTRSVIEKRVDCDPSIVHFQQVVLKDESDVDKTCVVIVVAQSKQVVAVKKEKDTYTYPMRIETGLVRRTYKQVNDRRRSVQRDNFDFIQELEQFTNDH